jgi:hypothetical protein
LGSLRRRIETAMRLDDPMWCCGLDRLAGANATSPGGRRLAVAGAGVNKLS